MCFCITLLVAVRELALCFEKKIKAQLSQPFMKSHSGQLKPKVSRKRGTGCLPLTELVPALHIPGMISEKSKRPAGMNLMAMDLLYLFIQDRDNTDLNTVTSDPQQKIYLWHAVSMTSACRNSGNKPST